VATSAPPETDSPEPIDNDSTAAELVPLLVIGAVTEITPDDPAAPAEPAAPMSPRGIVKLRIAALVVPTFTTLADVPGAPVDVVPTVTLPAEPPGPVGPTPPLTVTLIGAGGVTTTLIGSLTATPRKCPQRPA
jgi:hypothetical protein